MARAKRVVSVEIAGHEYKLRSEADPEWLQQIARQVDRAMSQIASRTRTVDSHQVAVLTALNLAREVILLREARDDARASLEHAVDPERMRALIEQVEAAAAPVAKAG